LVDTNVLVRRPEPAHHDHFAAVIATLRLIESGVTLRVAARAIGEFCAAATWSPHRTASGSMLP
jgi:hypothetical protein